MNLFVQDEKGQYITAPPQEIIRMGRSLCRSTLKRGFDFIGNSESAKEAIASKISTYQHEVFGCLFLNTKHRILKWVVMFQGTINSTTVYPREVVKEALRLNAAAVVLAHNHPSGDTTPSRQDIDLTNKLKEILKVIDVIVLDHIVVGDTIVSFSDMGLM